MKYSFAAEFQKWQLRPWNGTALLYYFYELNLGDILQQTNRSENAFWEMIGESRSKGEVRYRCPEESNELYRHHIVDNFRGIVRPTANYDGDVEFVRSETVDAVLLLQR